MGDIAEDTITLCMCF